MQQRWLLRFQSTKQAKILKTAKCSYWGCDEARMPYFADLSLSILSDLFHLIRRLLWWHVCVVLTVASHRFLQTSPHSWTCNCCHKCACCRLRVPSGLYILLQSTCECTKGLLAYLFLCQCWSSMSKQQAAFLFCPHLQAPSGIHCNPHCSTLLMPCYFLTVSLNFIRIPCIKWNRRNRQWSSAVRISPWSFHAWS